MRINLRDALAWEADRRRDSRTRVRSRPPRWSGPSLERIAFVAGLLKVIEHRDFHLAMGAIGEAGFGLSRKEADRLASTVGHAVLAIQSRIYGPEPDVDAEDRESPEVQRKWNRAKSRGAAAIFEYLDGFFADEGDDE
jgi:hypothetical protein